jgi:hypothetical protein
MAGVFGSAIRFLRPALFGLTALVSIGLVLTCGWLATMDLFLQHPGYEWRVLVELALVVEGALTFAVVEDLVSPAALRWPLAAGALATGLLGGWVVAEDLSRPGPPARHHFEGYLLIAGLILIVYAVLTIATVPPFLPRRPVLPRDR